VRKRPLSVCEAIGSYYGTWLFNQGQIKKPKSVKRRKRKAKK